jgi:serine protease Do
MTTLERAALILVITVVLPQLLGLVPNGIDPGNDRRQLPAPGPGLPAPDQFGTGPGAGGDRVRRPLPAATQSDPLFAVDTEAIPPGKLAFGTSFPIGQGIWLTARHLANAQCQRIVMLIAGRQIPATIAYLHPQSDLAVLKTAQAGGPPLPLDGKAMTMSETGFTFGFPAGTLGATEDQLLGRSRMQLGGKIDGTGPMLTWAEVARFPDSLSELNGMSGGPMLDHDGRIVGIMVAASKRRGRVETVAPEVLQATETSFALDPASAAAAPAGEVTGQSVSLGDAADELSRDRRIAKTYCIPAS